MIWRWILYGVCIASALMFRLCLDIKDEDVKNGLAGTAFSIIAVILALIIVQVIKF